MAFSLLKKKPGARVEDDGLATTLRDGGETSASDAALLSGDSVDSAADAHQLEENQSEFDALLDDQPAGSDQKTFGGGSFPTLQAGGRTATRFRRILLLLAVALIALVAGGGWVVSRTSRAARQIDDVSAALVQSQRLTEAALRIMAGHEEGFKTLRESADALTGSVRGLHADLGTRDADNLKKVVPLADRLGNDAGAVLAQQKLLSETDRALRAIAGQSDDLQAAAEQVSALKVQRGASAAEIAAAGRLVVLTQRIGKSASQMLTANDLAPNAVSALDNDLALFHDTAQGLLEGSDQLHLPATRDPDMRSRIQSLLQTFDQTRSAAANILSNRQSLSDARTAQSAIVTDSQTLAQALQALQAHLAAAAGINWLSVVVLLVPALIVLLSAIGLANAQSHSGRQRHLQTEQQRLVAEQQQQEVKRINEANQSAILRLMNELQTVAEGDLTQQATVTEDITGAIADSVNYTVEELRTLVGNVQGAATRVTETTSKVEVTSTQLLAASTEQLRKIHETGQAVVDMAERINQVSTQAQESAQVARQSLEAAASGLTAVQDSIGGMNTIRDQIQETSKRIKRLGESSQEIGEITELIADITEQTNVLALNAAIQAASAGEAGRGFSVVAEEVQRLAERSGQATRQIAALVKVIQTDTQDAVAAMERSTRGVVVGARLSDNAGTALTEIDRVSRRLAQLIEQISSAAVQEAQKANGVAGNIQHIFAMTEQTGQSTRSTANQVRELARIADELRQSVARFKIA
jgi:twitching motility protein PilJ